MVNEATLEKSVCLNCEDEVRQICGYLSRDFGIEHFSYARCLKDGTHFGVSTHNAWMKHFYLKEYKKYCVFHKTIEAYKSGVFLWSAIEEQASFIGFREHSSIDHGIALIDKQPDYCEIFNFATHQSNYKIINFYLNHLDILWRHTFYFKERAAELLKKAEADRLILPRNNSIDSVTTLFSHELYIQSTLANVPIKRYLLENLGKNSYLTSAEAKCVYHFIQGKHIKEIAKLTDLSPRTVDNHIESARQRLNCSTKIELVNKILRKTNLKKIYFV